MRTSDLGQGIKSIQRGTIALTGATLANTATITAVNTAKTVLIHLGQASTTTASGGYDVSMLNLTDGTTVTATKGVGAGGTNLTVSFQVVEYR